MWGEKVRGRGGQNITFDTGEKQIKLSDGVEVREADVTPEKSTIVKGQKHAASAVLAGRAKAHSPEGHALPTEG